MTPAASKSTAWTASYERRPQRPSPLYEPKQPQRNHYGDNSVQPFARRLIMQPLSGQKIINRKMPGNH